MMKTSWLKTMSLLVLCDNLGGGMGWEVGQRFKKEGTYVYLWVIHVDVMAEAGTKLWASPVTQRQRTCLQCRRQEFESWAGKILWMANHSSILAWRIPMARGAWRAEVHRVTKNRT